MQHHIAADQIAYTLALENANTEFERMSKLGDPLKIKAEIQSKAAKKSKPSTPAGVAVIDINGPLESKPSFWGELFGWTDYQTLKIQIAEANKSKKVKEIAMVIDSPGGNTKGLFEVVDVIRASAKPVTAIIDGMGASAGYALATGASRIVTSKAAEVGSIGTIMVGWDDSEYYKKQGMKPIVIASGEIKKAFWGEEVTKEQIAHYQGIIDKLTEIFIDTISSSRDLDRKAVEKLATGAMWVGQDAADNGLVDAITTTDAELAAIAQRVAATSKRNAVMARARATHNNINKSN